MRQRFLDEAPRSWAEYRLFAENLDGSAKRVHKRGDEVQMDHRFQYKHNQECRQVLSQSLLPKSPTGELFDYNPQYAFKLGRKDISRPWVVTALDTSRSNLDDPLVKETLLSVTPLRTLILVHTEDLTDLVKQSSFRVMGTASVSRYGADLVEVTFDNTHPLKEEGKPFFPIQQGTLLLDPNRMWCLRACELKCKYGDGETTVKQESEFGEVFNNCPVPKRSLNVNDVAHPTLGLLHRTWLTEFDVHPSVTLPGNPEFTLSAFGLPEPFAAKVKSPSRWFLWVALAGLSCLVVGSLLAWFRRRGTSSLTVP